MHILVVILLQCWEFHFLAWDDYVSMTWQYVFMFASYSHLLLETKNKAYVKPHIFSTRNTCDKFSISILMNLFARKLFLTIFFCSL